MDEKKDEWLITAELAGLKLDEQERNTLAREAEKMRKLFLTMADSDTKLLEPTTHALVQKNCVREDAIAPFSNKEALLDAAPDSEGDFFLIPNVL